MIHRVRESIQWEVNVPVKCNHIRAILKKNYIICYEIISSLPNLLHDMIKEQNKRMWVFILYFHLISLAIAGRNDSLNKTPQNVALNQMRSRQVRNIAPSEQRQGNYRVIGLPTGQKPTAPSKIATNKCRDPHYENDDTIDHNCEDSGKKYAEHYDCPKYYYGTTNPSQYITATVAEHVYLHMCPKLLCWFYTTPCPRKWILKYTGGDRVTCNDKTGKAFVWHMYLYQLHPDTLYDLQSNIWDYNRTELSLPIFRFHTCQEGKSVTNLVVVAYGLGWIYFIWRRPLENCYANINYEEEYTVDGQSGTYNQDQLGNYLGKNGYYNDMKFHPCPSYPSFFCFMVSENIIPFTKITFKVKAKRFQGEASDDGPWVTIEFTTDDHGQGFPFCPKQNIFLTLWFLILLIVLLLLLLLIAALLIVLLYKRKREIERLEDEPDFEEEKIPPSNIFEKVWERLKNFFNELCPKPKKPPPPPPPPPPKPKKKPTPKPKPKPKKKPPPVEKPKAKSPSPTPSPPPPPPAPPKPKKARGPRTEGRGRAAATAIDTKRMASGVGGVRARRRRR